MKRGFFTIMAAQFFSSLADNALFVAAVQLLRSNHAPQWQQAALVPMFALFYVVLAPFVGALADSLPKGRVMLISNFIKVAGCLLMLFGTHPLLAYAVVGLGAAAYSPAKYGILTELLPASQLVKANGWIEGLTIGSIILGVLLGGQLVGPQLANSLLAFDFPLITTCIDTPPEAAIAVLIFVYLLAALFNTHIPLTGVVMRPLPHRLNSLLSDFWSCNVRLWRDKLGQISLAATTLIWGVAGNLRFIVLAWAAAALGYTVTEASTLQGVVAHLRAPAEQQGFDRLVACFFGSNGQNTSEAIQRIPFDPFQQGNNAVLLPISGGFEDDRQAGRSGMATNALVSLEGRATRVLRLHDLGYERAVILAAELINLLHLKSSPDASRSQATNNAQLQFTKRQKLAFGPVF